MGHRTGEPLVPAPMRPHPLLRRPAQVSLELRLHIGRSGGDVGLAIVGDRDRNRNHMHDKPDAGLAHHASRVKLDAIGASDQRRRGVGMRRPAEERHGDALALAQIRQEAQRSPALTIFMSRRKVAGERSKRPSG